MGQWGAFGYASEYGWGYKQILSHYYGGTTLGTLATRGPDITVHLVELDGHNTIPSAVDGGALVATWTGGTPIAPPPSRWQRQGARTTSFPGPVARALAAGCDHCDRRDHRECPGWLGGFVGARGLHPRHRGLAPTRGPSHQPGGGTDNVLPLEDYVDGVVPAESPVIWASLGGQAELEAQAVAARSYALAFVASSGEICDTIACQMYTGLPDQYGPTADAEVAATSGQVLYCEAGTSCGPAGSIA